MAEQDHTPADNLLLREFAKRYADKQPYVEELFSDLEHADLAQAREALLKEVRLLHAQARLTQLAILQPYFSALLNLLSSVPCGGDCDRAELVATLRELSTCILQEAPTVGAAPSPPSAERREELLARAGDLARAYQQTPCIDLSEPEFSLPAAMLMSYVAEGNTLLENLGARLQASAGGKTGAEFLKETLACVDNLLGNTDLLCRAPGGHAPLGHPLHVALEFLQAFQSALRGLKSSAGLTPGQVLPALVPPLQAVRGLLDDLKSARTTSSPVDSVLDSLMALQAAATPLVEAEPSDPLPAADGESQDKEGGWSGRSQTGQDSSFIQVRLDRIEYLTRLAGELVVARNTLGHIHTLLTKDENRTQAEQALARSEKTFAQTISELDDLVLAIRMRRIGELFRRFPRMVRDLAQSQGKSIDLVIEGEETELDNTILQAVSDPLVHLVRNACDHGLESHGDRQAKGKPAAGKLLLAAKVVGANVVIDVTDDGRGIDPAIMRRKAVEKGLMSAAEAEQLSDVAARELIFRPAFSTSETVTKVSGRGVGMDVVTHNLLSVGGTVVLDSRAGEYTRIRLTLPVAMSIARGLVVAAAGDRFLIPLQDVHSMINIEGAQVHNYGGQRLLGLRDATVPLVSLTDLLGSATKAAGHAVVLLRMGQRLAGLQVEDILGIEDIAVRPLPGSMESLPIYTGCSIMADGIVVPVMNPAKLLGTSGTEEEGAPAESVLAAG